MNATATGLVRVLAGLALAWGVWVASPAWAQTLTDTLGAAAIQSELQGQQLQGQGGNTQAQPGAQQGQAQGAQAGAAAATVAPPGNPGPPAEPAFLLSLWKPLLVFLVLLGWGWVVSHLDKDAAYFYLGRYVWNLAQMACGVLGFGLMLLIPIFPIGLFLGLMILLGGILGYAYYRNTKVPEGAKWSLSLDSFRQKYEGMQHRSAQKHATLVFLTPDESRLDVPSGEDPRAEAHATLEAMLDFAIPRNGDQVTVDVTTQAAAMNVRIDGVLYPQPPMEPKQAVILIDYLKELARLDVQDRRKRQHASLKLDAGELGRHTLELETSGSTRGLSMVLNIDAQVRKQMPVQHLGLLEPQRQQLAAALEQTGRVILVTSPPRHGLTTTLYSLLAQHDPYTQSVLTLERETTLQLEGVTHNEMGDAAPQQWNEKLSSILRSDPNVMMLDTIPEPATAQMIARSAQEVRFYLAMQEEDTFAALNQWVRLCGNRKSAGQSLGAITAQRLVRKLCTTCRTPYKPDPQALRKMNLPPDRVSHFYHASGQVLDRDKPVQCPDCMGLGYKFRMGVFEVMVLDDEARNLIAAGNLDQLKAYLRKQRLMPFLLNEAGLMKVVEGLTDVKEVTRAMASGKRPPGPSGGGGRPSSNPAPAAAAGGAAATG